MVGYALKYFSRCGEDLWECIVEECQKVRVFLFLYVMRLGWCSRAAPDGDGDASYQPRWILGSPPVFPFDLYLVCSVGRLIDRTLLLFFNTRVPLTIGSTFSTSSTRSVSRPYLRKRTNHHPPSRLRTSSTLHHSLLLQVADTFSQKRQASQYVFLCRLRLSGSPPDR